MDYFIRGVIIALILAIPVGPISIMCIQKALNKGFLHGVIFGIGISLADFVYGMGITFFSTGFLTFFDKNKHLINILGGLFLIYLGYLLYKKSGCTDLNDEKGLKKRISFFTGFILTFTNPLTPITLVATFNTFNIISDNLNALTALFASLGLAIGSFLWWVVLSFTVDKFKTLITPTFMAYTNKLAGVIILCFGVFSVFR